MEPRWADCYLRHFAQHLGKPFDVETYHGDDGLPLRLATYDLRFKGYRVYASIGMAEEVESDVGEVVLLADDFGKDVPELFVNSLFFILQNNIPLGSRFAVGGVDMLNPDFAEHFAKVAIYYRLADELADGFEKLDCEGELGHVYQGIFISWVELDFLKRKGPDAFEEKLKSQEGDKWSLRRPSCL